MTKLLGACQLLALRDQSSAQEVLCLMLEWSLLDGSSTASPSSSAEDVNTLGLQVVTTLQSTESGRRRYMELCDRQLHLKELVPPIVLPRSNSRHIHIDDSRSSLKDISKIYRF